jgi:DNA-nicking Smr family endonuclease
LEVWNPLKPGDTSDNEAKIFLDAMTGVKPLKPHNLAEPRRNLPALQQPVSRLDDSEERGESDFCRPGIQKTVLRKLRNGHIPIEDELDLHGDTVADAEHKLRTFVTDAQAADKQRAVRVIHGKGLGSPEGKAVLKPKVLEWLRQFDAVLAFCTPGQRTAAPAHFMSC